LCDYVFTTMRLNRLWAEVIAENEAALSLYESIGFEREGVLREHVHKGGQYVDVVRIAVLERRFRLLDPELRRSLRLDDRATASA